MSENLDDVLNAIHAIQEQPREEGKTSFPDMGSILAVVKSEGVTRHNRESTANYRYLVRWHCPECGIHRCGFITADDTEPRVCRGIPREGSGICGAIMNEVHRGPGNFRKDIE